MSSSPPVERKWREKKKERLQDKGYLSPEGVSYQVHKCQSSGPKEICLYKQERIKVNNNSKLIFRGKGELFDEIIRRVDNMGLSDDVLFIGVKPDVNRYLSAADCYIMPSLYEGLPVAAIEAECEGLPCVFSENITKEVKITDNVEFLSLDDSVDKWVNQILMFKGKERIDCSEIVKKSGYDMQDVAKKMQEFYEK